MSWTLLVDGNGDDYIYGSSTNQEIGSSVAMSSNAMVMVTGGKNPVNNDNKGIVKIYEKIENGGNVSWVQQGNDIVGNSSSSNPTYFFGSSVAMSGDGLVVVIGDPEYNNRMGRFFIYTYDGTNWVQTTSFNTEFGNDSRFGSQVEISSDGSTIIAGSMHSDVGGSYRGAVNIYKKNINDVWEKYNDSILGTVDGDNFGKSLTLSNDGTYIGVGARGQDNSTKGRIYILKDDGTSYNNFGIINGNESGGQLGESIAMSGDGQTIIGGAPYNKVGSSMNGEAAVYTNNGTTSQPNWVQLGTDIPGESVYDYFGTDVAITNNGERVAVGAYLNDGNGNNAGHVRVYDYDGGTSDWVQVGADINGSRFDVESGKAIALSSDGAILAIGARETNVVIGGLFLQAGEVRLYESSADVGGKLYYDIPEEEPAAELSQEETNLKAEFSEDLANAIVDAKSDINNLSENNKAALNSFLETATGEERHTLLDYLFADGVSQLTPSYFAGQDDITTLEINKNILGFGDRFGESIETIMVVNPVPGQMITLGLDVISSTKGIYVNLRPSSTDSSESFRMILEDPYFIIVNKVGTNSNYSLLYNDKAVSDQTNEYKLAGSNKTIEFENGKTVKLTFGGIGIEDQTQGGSGSSSGDPHIYPIYGNKYELPQKESAYRMLQGENLIVNACTRKVEENERLAIQNYYENVTGEVAPGNLMTEGVFYKSVFVEADGERLVFNFDKQKAFATSNYFNIEARDGDVSKMNKYEKSESIKQMAVTFNHSTQGKVELCFNYFSNPQIKFGISANLENVKGVSGLLVREYNCESMKVESMKSTEELKGIKCKNKVNSYFNC